MIQSCLCGL